MAEKKEETKQAAKKFTLTDAARSKHAKALGEIDSMEGLVEYAGKLKVEVRNALIKEIADTTDRIVGF